MVTIKTNLRALQEARIKQGFSFRNLAKKAGLNYVTAFKIENNKTNPSALTAQKICNVLGLQFDELFEIVDSNKGA